MPTNQNCKPSKTSQNTFITTPGPLTAGMEYPPSVAWRDFWRLVRHYAAIGRERERQANAVSTPVSEEKIQTNKTA